jgi:hypothetical protein
MIFDEATSISASLQNIPFLLTYIRRKADKSGFIFYIESIFNMSVIVYFVDVLYFPWPL